MAHGNLPGPYDIKAYKCRTQTTVTNKPGLMPYRGVARPGVCFAIEMTIDALAREIGIEADEIRAKNMVSEDNNSSLMQGIQGGPLMHVMAAKAVAFGEALKPEFKEYIKQVISNAKILSEVLVKRGFRVVTGGTDSHIVWLDLGPKNLTGDRAE